MRMKEKRSENEMEKRKGVKTKKKGEQINEKTNHKKKKK